MARKDKKVLGYLFLLLFLTALQNSVFNLHVHICADGSVTTHAHPFAHLPGTTPQHSHADCAMHSPGHNYIDTAVAPKLPVPDGQAWVVVQSAVIGHPSQWLRAVVTLRGPPRA